MSERLLAKMTARGMNIENSGGGGTIRISSTDVAGGLGMGNLSRGAYLYGLAVYAGHDGVLVELERLAWMRAVDLAVENGWKVIRGKENLRNAARLALMEHVEPTIHFCSRCKGSGHTLNRSRMSIPCVKCEGKGNQVFSNVFLADQIGVDESAIRKTWLNRYERIHADLFEWRNEVLSHLWRQFGGKSIESENEEEI